jgi:YebC/PmpR family DNA-binding regulatory protein
MSGHSKWAKIQGSKGVADAKRAGLFTKAVRNIIIAAKEGPDPEMNFKLRLAIDKAKEVNMPKDNIERAIAKGSGTGGGAEIKEVVYEGYGPNGVAILIEAATDNSNRTLSEIKHIFSVAGGSLGAAGAVKWMFEHKGVLRLPADKITGDKDEFMLSVIDLGAEDVKEEDGGLTIFTSFENFPKVKKALEAKGLTFEYAQADWVAKDVTSVDNETKEKLTKLAEQLDNQDDVSNFYMNAEY